MRAMQRAVKKRPSPEHVATARATAIAQGEDPDLVEEMLLADAEMWMNDKFVVTVGRRPDGSVVHLSIRRVDRKPEPFMWRQLQQIKNDIAGTDVEAVELFPAEERLVDCANQRHLWCMPPGTILEVGFNDGRKVGGPEDAVGYGAVQS